MGSSEINSATTTVALPVVPVLDAPIPRSVFVVLLPLVMLAGTAGLLVVGGGGSTSLLMGGLMAVSLIGMLLSGGSRQTKPAATVAAERESFLRQLARAGQDVTAREATIRVAAHARHAAPVLLRTPAGVAAQGIPSLTVQVGVGEVPAVVRCETPESDDRGDPEPFADAALRRFLTAHATTSGMPLTVDLVAGRSLTLMGCGATDLARSVILRCAQLSSSTLRIVLMTSDDTPGWEWLKWLPHHRAPESDEPLRTADVLRARRWLAGERGAEQAVDVVLLVTVAQPRAAREALSARSSRFLTLHVEPPDTIEPGGGPVLRVTGTSLARFEAGALERWGTADRLGNAEVTAAARLVASRRPAAVPPPFAHERSASTDLATLLQVGTAHDYRPHVHQVNRPVTDRLRVPIGTDDGGAPVHLDLKEAALGGVGPHGLLVGATGSGKSELLRTLVLGLVATHDPRALNLVLIDFKGGAGFLALEHLPHVAAVITNLADEAVLVARMADALGGEVSRRQELLRRAGNASSATAYEAARRRSPDLPELPALVIVCDEFTELLVQRPDLADTFVAIGRLGRSLGVHLLMSSQRMDEGRMRGLDAHLSYRIALKTFSAADSRAVLDVDAAYRLPSTPGVGYLKTDASEPRAFTAAYVSGPVPAAGPTVAGPPSGPAGCDIRLFTAFPSEPERAVAATRAASRRVGTAPDPGQSTTAAAPTLIDLWIERLRDHGPRAHQIWLPPLGAAPVLDELPRTDDAVVQGGRLRVAIGVVDRPFDQRRDPLWADFTGAGGHALVVGGPRSGKSTVLAALLLALSRDSAPNDLHCYVVDLGGGSLASLVGVPHIGGVANANEPDRVRRMIAQVAGELAAREAAPRPPDADGPPPETFLIIDGWPSFRTGFEELEPTVAAIVQRGLSYGIHVVLAASRWADVRPALRDLMGQRFELRLGDPAESEVDRRRAAEVPDRAPGRGLTRDGLHFQAATPGPPAAPSDVRLVVADRRARWPSAGAPPVRQLPAMVGVGDLPPGEPGGRLVAVGLGESRLQAVGIDVIDEPHLVVWGDSGSGKTSFLRTLAHIVARQWGPAEARFLVVDHRRTLLGQLPEDHLAGHGTSAGSTAGLIADAVTLLTARLPDGNIDAGQLRRRDWWTGADLYVLVDDYDLVAGGSVNPLGALLDLLPHARDVGLHLVVCRRVAGGGRALYDPVLQRLRELGGPGLVLSGMPDEGVLHGSQRAAIQPPGRGFWVTRTSTERVQLALAVPP